MSIHHKKGEIKLSYMVLYARRQPMYSRTNSQTKQVKLTRMAMIAQKTGEDWNNVKLTLPTSTPKSYIQQITPTGWWVDYYQPETSRNYGNTTIVEAAPAPVAPETFTVGVTDYTFNTINAIYGRLLKTPDGHIVTAAYWQQQETISHDEIPYYEHK